MGRLFGTDGVRGVANTELSPELAYRLGRAVVSFLQEAEERPRIVIGKDTRLSGDLLEAAMMAGINSAGADVLRLGVVSTPAVAYLARNLGAAGGVMISASHNPAEYNGIKFFTRGGYKLPDEVEDRLEELVRDHRDDLPRPTGEGVGRVLAAEGEVERYIQYLMSTLPGNLSGLKIVVDAANGSASQIAPEVLRRLGVEVIPINDRPNGLNINVACGSTHPRGLQEAVLHHGADLGLAHDGDADRVMAVDEKGQVVDGDQIMAICGLDLLRKGRLKENTIVATVMSNLGLDLAMKRAGGRVVKTKVGDRYVLEEMLKRDLTLGGEQSGHLIFLEHSTTGDGILTALQLLAVMREGDQPLSSLATVVQKMPQVLLNFRVKRKEGLEDNARIRKAIRSAEEELGEMGRVLVRPSGTEPLVRVMLEGPEKRRLEELAQGIGQVIQEEMGREKE
ncbi:MAG: phosphoglucosamine mutase [Firmicutes bacterium]|nr:phosphoglucosamine mutase [Bacillota bacterium]